MKQYIVDAFTDKIFHGNQAAVCVLENWLPEKLMMNIAKENNFSETAFTVKCGDKYHLRWFTPSGEINLCGHATLATSYILFKFYETSTKKLVFSTLSGDLIISRADDYIVMDFPAYHYSETSVTEQMAKAMGAKPSKAYFDRDLLLVYEDEDIIRNMAPDFEAMKLLDKEIVGVTAPGHEYDCVSRCFAPKLKINEDPVTGSIHCMIAPYWAERLGKHTISAYQASERGGEMKCEIRCDRVVIYGKAALFSSSELNITILT